MTTWKQQKCSDNKFYNESWWCSVVESPRYWGCSETYQFVKIIQIFFSFRKHYFYLMIGKWFLSIFGRFTRQIWSVSTDLSTRSLVSPREFEIWFSDKVTKGWVFLALVCMWLLFSWLRVRCRPWLHLIGVCIWGQLGCWVWVTLWGVNCDGQMKLF